MAFLHQAARYRGKANYRDAIYLAPTENSYPSSYGFIGDLPQVLRGFTAYQTRGGRPEAYKWFWSMTVKGPMTQLGPRRNPA